MRCVRPPSLSAATMSDEPVTVGALAGARDRARTAKDHDAIDAALCDLVRLTAEVERLRGVIDKAAGDLDVAIDDGDVSTVREELFAVTRTTPPAQPAPVSPTTEQALEAIAQMAARLAELARGGLSLGDPPHNHEAVAPPRPR